MSKIQRKISVFLFIIVNYNFTLFANDKISFFLEDEPIYTSNSKSSPGFLLEVVIEMSKKLKIEPEIEFLPWIRAQSMAKHTQNSVIFPLTRTESREPNYKWICKIFDVPVMFINKKGNPVINTVEEANQLRKIGVIWGTPQEEKLKQLGVKPVARMKGKMLFEVLAKNVVDAIFTARPEAVIAWKQGGYKEEIQYGSTLQTLPLWIAANKNSDKIISSQWDEALKKLKTSGFFNLKFEKYYGK